MFSLKDQRKKKNITQIELASLVHVTQQAIEKYENGKRRPSPEVAMRIAEVLDFNWTLFYKKESGDAFESGECDEH